MDIRREENMFVHETAHGRAELHYEEQDGLMRIFHTSVPEQERGKGIAEALTLEAFRFAVSQGWTVVPDCAYTKHFLRTHEEWRKYSTDT